MFFDFPYWQIGFSYDEWEQMPRGTKALIRDYYLNNKDSQETLRYSFYESDFQIRMIEKRYELKRRPLIKIGIADFCVS